MLDLLITELLQAKETLELSKFKDDCDKENLKQALKYSIRLAEKELEKHFGDEKKK